MQYSDFYPNSLTGVKGTTLPSLTESRLDEIIGGIDNDSILSTDEKFRILIPLDYDLTNRYNLLLLKANAIGTINVADLINAKLAWDVYKNGLTPAWNDTAEHTTIVRADFRNILNALVVALNELDADIETTTSSQIADRALEEAVIRFQSDLFDEEQLEIAGNEVQIQLDVIGQFDYVDNVGILRGDQLRTSETGLFINEVADRVETGLDSDGTLLLPIPDTVLADSNVLMRAGGGEFVGALNATDDTVAYALMDVIADVDLGAGTAVLNAGQLKTSTSGPYLNTVISKVQNGLDSTGKITQPIPDAVLENSNVVTAVGGGDISEFGLASVSSVEARVDSLSDDIVSGDIIPAIATTFVGRGDLASKNVAATVDISPQAVTSPARYDSAVEVDMTGSGPMTSKTTLWSFSRTVTGEVLEVDANFYIRTQHDQDDYDLYVVVERSGVEKFRAQMTCQAINGDGWFFGWQNISFTDQPPAGTVTYVVRVFHTFSIGSPGSFAKWNHKNRTMSIREFKR